MNFYLLALGFAAFLKVAVAVDFYESGDSIIIGDDGCSRTIQLSPQLGFFGQCYLYCSVSANGIVEFFNKRPANCSETLNHVVNDSFPIRNRTFVAVFYGDVDVDIDSEGNGGRINYNEPVVTDKKSLEMAREQIQTWTEYKDFEPTYLIVATWDKVGYHQKQNDLLNTFQSVVATDGTMTFAIFLYQQLEWSQGQDTSRARVGFNDGVRRVSWKMPCSGKEEIISLTNSSNIGENGVWIFRIDQDTIEPACKDKDACEEDILCSCLRTNQQSCICSSNTITDDEQLTCNAEVNPSTEPTERSCPGNAAEVFASSTVIGLLLIVSILIMIIS